MTSEPVRREIPIDLKERVRKWANVVEVNAPLISQLRKEALGNLVVELREFAREGKFWIIFQDESLIEPCPKCDYERGRVYQWLGRWYFMCMNCALGMPEPKLVDWGKYGKLNEEDRKYYENRKREREKTGE